MGSSGFIASYDGIGIKQKCTTPGRHLIFDVVSLGSPCHGGKKLLGGIFWDGGCSQYVFCTDWGPVVKLQAEDLIGLGDFLERVNKGEFDRKESLDEGR